MSIEEIYVKHVYNTIAKEFSDTRYRPWTCVEQFLDGIKPRSYIADIVAEMGKICFIKKIVIILVAIFQRTC